MKDILFFQNYTPVADVTTIVIGLIYCFILRSTYTVRQKSLTVFKISVVLVITAAALNIAYHQLVNHLTEQNVIPVYILRDCYYIMLMTVSVLFCLYIMDLVRIRRRSKLLLEYAIWGGYAFCVICEVITPVTRRGFYIDPDLGIHQNYYTDIFRVCYIYFGLLLAGILVMNRRKFIAKMFQCMYSTMIMSVFLMVLQAQYRSTSYTCVSYVLPIMSVLFLFHHNSYDIRTGTLDSRAFESYMHDLKGEEFGLIHFYLYEDNLNKIKDWEDNPLRYYEKSIPTICVFRFEESHFVMIYREGNASKTDAVIRNMIESYQFFYEEKNMDYRIICSHSSTQFQTGQEYIALADFVRGRMPLNTVYRCTGEDITAFSRAKYILGELHDIYQKHDLEDERVKVYCQPVLNTNTGTFSTAEALMRLELPECGMVYPDQFIPLAEKQDYIHVLSLIILHKTCINIRNMEQKGYRIERISVNFSTLELRDKNFCNDVIRVIKDTGIDFGKIAIELTESQNEQDFEMVKTIMTELQTSGIKFYLDDFGTGYSNFERIIGLPIDIIKFDRSLTILAGKDEGSRYMVGSFSDIFKKSNYQILFEGVENDADEQQCRRMNAQYLQGYKYSRPIPMEQLEAFVEKKRA